MLPGSWEAPGRLCIHPRGSSTNLLYGIFRHTAYTATPWGVGRRSGVPGSYPKTIADYQQHSGMRFAWLRKKQGLEDSKMGTGARLIYIGHNVIWWLPVVLVVLGVWSYRAMPSGSLLSLSSELSPICIATKCCPSKPHSDSCFVRPELRHSVAEDGIGDLEPKVRFPTLSGE